MLEHQVARVVGGSTSGFGQWTDHSLNPKFFSGQVVGVKISVSARNFFRGPN
jgi:hypothetical protein